jgi:hypothetical protein
VTPVKFLLMIASEWINHSNDRWLSTVAHMIEIKHALNSLEENQSVHWSADEISFDLPLSACPTRLLWSCSRREADHSDLSVNCHWLVEVWQSRWTAAPSTMTRNDLF